MSETTHDQATDGETRVEAAEQVEEVEAAAAETETDRREAVPVPAPVLTPSEALATGQEAPGTQEADADEGTADGDEGTADADEGTADADEGTADGDEGTLSEYRPGLAGTADVNPPVDIAAAGADRPVVTEKVEGTAPGVDGEDGSQAAEWLAPVVVGEDGSQAAGGVAPVVVGEDGSQAAGGVAVDAEGVAVDDIESAGDASSQFRAARSRKVPTRAHLEKEGEIAADFLETLLDICDLDGDIDVDIDGDRAAVSIVDSDDGRVPRRLVGANGNVLDALQELTRLAVYSSTGDRSRLVLDIAGHRSDRRAELREIAGVAIASVRETGQQKALEPMSPFERKIIHDEVLAAGLHSESDGKEPHRFVVIHSV